MLWIFRSVAVVEHFAQCPVNFLTKKILTLYIRQRWLSHERSTTEGRASGPRPPRSARQRWAPNWNGVRIALGLPPSHGPKEKDQNTNRYERERGASEKLRYPIETLTTPGLHECEQGQNQPDAVAD